MRILIVEDELVTAMSMEEHLRQIGYGVVGVARNYPEAMHLLDVESPDLAVVDVELRGSADGIAVTRDMLRHKAMPIIYLTGHKERDVFERAKHTHPAAYLLKPFRPDELPLHIDLALHNYYAGNLPVASRPSEYLFLPFGKVYVRLLKQEILYAEAKSNYTQIHLTPEGFARTQPRQRNGPLAVMLTMNLGHLHQHLPGNFYRLSRSLLINLDYLDRIETEQIVLGGQAIPLPEGSRKALLDRLAVVKTR